MTRRGVLVTPLCGALLLLGVASVVLCAAVAEAQRGLVQRGQGGEARAEGTLLGLSAYNGQSGGAFSGLVFLSPIHRDAWLTTIFVQNIIGSEAHIGLIFYDSDGYARLTVNESIPAHGCRIFDRATMSWLPAGFQGSAVVSSDCPVAAVVNIEMVDGDSLATYQGVYAGTTGVTLPLVMRNNAGFYTWFSVQNVSTSPTLVHVEYIPAVSGNSWTSPSVTIQPNAAHIFDQRDMVELGAKFVGSAVAYCDKPIVATVVQVGEVYKGIMSYNGFAGGSRSVALPLLMAGYDGYYTGFQVSNVGSRTTVVTVEYGPNSLSSFAPSSQSVALAPRQYLTVLQLGSEWEDRYLGSATLSSAEETVALVNVLAQSGPPCTGSYAGVADSELACDLYLPRVAHIAAAGLTSRVYVQNPANLSTVARIDFYHKSGALTAVRHVSIAAHGVVECATENVPELGQEWEGSATISADGLISAVVMQVASAPSQAATPTATRISTATRTCTPTPTLQPTRTPTRLYCPEPQNNHRAGACGPLMPGVVYHEYISSAADEFDWFYFDMATAHTIEAWLSDIPVGCNYDLLLRDSVGNGITSSASDSPAGEHIPPWGPLPSGRYYVVVESIDQTWNASEPYGLRVDFGQAAPTPSPTRSPTPTTTRSGPTMLHLPMILRRSSIHVTPTPAITPTPTQTPTNTLTPTRSPTPTATILAGATRVLEPAGITLVYVAGGLFWMGSSYTDPDAEVDEMPEHPVYLNSFWIGQTEVTNEQYHRFMDAGGYTDGGYWNAEGWQWRQANNITQPYYWGELAWSGSQQPVMGVSWYEASAYARWAGGRLPTEAEWEYAARGGPLSQGLRYAGSNDVGEVGWYRDNAGLVTHAVAQKRPNELGLYDTTGNVSEWCADWYDPYYYSESPVVNPQGPASGVLRVYRGGWWGDDRSWSRCAFRGRSYLNYRWNAGLRLVVAVAP